LMQGFNQRNQNAQQGMMAVVDHFTKQAERRKEEKSLAKSMDAFYKTESGGKVLKDMGIPLHDYLSMSDGDRLAIGKAGHESVALKGLQQKFEQGAAEFLAKQKMDDLQLAAQKQETEGNTAFDLAQAAASRPGTLEIPNTTLPGIFPDRTVGTRSQPTLQEAAQQILQTPGAARSRAGIQLLEAAAREREQGGGENVMPVPATIGGRNLIVNPKSGAFQDVTPQSSSAIPKDFVALGATMDESGKLDIRYGPPKAEGKALSQTEVAGIAALNQAEMDLNTLENTYKELGENYGGPVSARVKSLAMGGQNPNIASLENAITAATPNLARGVFREVGVLTDQDVARYKQLLPAPTDTQEVRTRKIKQLRDRIAQGRKEMVTSLEAAGRDVQGFSKGAGGDVPRFDSEDAARAANVGTNVFEMYDPATATYRKARLK